MALRTSRTSVRHSSLDTEHKCSGDDSPSGNRARKLKQHFKNVIMEQTRDLSVLEVPGGLREQYITGYYREPNQKFTSYLGSIFEIHNESLNIWTAILSVFCIFFWLCRHVMERSILSIPDAWPLTLVASAMITTHIASANAHTMCHHSVEYSGVFYMFDYFGITIYLYLAAIATFVYSVPIASTQALMSVALILSLFNSVAWPWFCSSALAAYRRTNELSQRPSLSKKLFLLNCFNAAFCGFAALTRVYHLPMLPFKNNSREESDQPLPVDIGGYWYLAWIIVSWVDLAVYKFHLPESFLKTRSRFWDLFHSHTIHHMLALASNICHLEALETDWETKLASGGFSDDYLTVFQNVSTFSLIVALSNFSVIFVLVGNFFTFIRYKSTMKSVN